MQSKATIAIGTNVKRLMQHSGRMSQRELAKEAGLSQSAVGFLLRYRDDRDRHPTVSTVEAVAQVFGLQAWQLLIPDQPLQALLDKQLEEHTTAYLHIGEGGRTAVNRVTSVELRIAEAETRMDQAQRSNNASNAAS